MQKEEIKFVDKTREDYLHEPGEVKKNFNKAQTAIIGKEQ